MPLTQAKVRITLRWVHFILGLVILCYIYSPFHKYLFFQIFIKFIAIPVIVLSGIWIWKFNIFNRFFGIKG